MKKIIQIQNATFKYPIDSEFFQKRVSYITALNNISLDIFENEILGLVGESGCGKSTLGKSISKLINLNNGKILFNNINISNLNGQQLLKFRKQVQVIFQNPYASLDPKMKIYDILKEPLDVHKIGSKLEKKNMIEEIVELTGLTLEDLKKYPHQFSGGQRQRIAIARALILKPKFVIADEPVSALDVSIQAQIINLLLELKKKFNLTILFISHDLNVVKYISDRIAVMYLGEIIELGKVRQIFENPQHPYTKILLNSIPKFYNINNIKQDQKNFTIDTNENISLENYSQFCNFSNKCTNFDEQICCRSLLKLSEIENSHFVMCCRCSFESNDGNGSNPPGFSG